MAQRFLLALLAMLALAIAAPAQATSWSRCEEDGYLSAHFDERLTPRRCEVIVEVPIRYRSHTSILRAIRPAGGGFTSDPAFVGRMEEAASAIGNAMNRMGPGLRLGDVTIYYSNLVSPREVSGPEVFQKGDTSAWTDRLIPLSPPGSTLPGECPITYFKGSQRASGDALVFTLAHEVFHCIQNGTWSSLHHRNWLIEASAEYFAWLAKPSNGRTGDGYVSEFDQDIQGTPLGEMSYEGVPFYLWYGDNFRPEGVQGFLRGNPEPENITPDTWWAFTEDYYDRIIHLPNDQPLPSMPRSGPTRRISATQSVPLSSRPLTFNTTTFVFPRGKLFHLTYGSQPRDARHFWRNLGGEAWATPPTSITTCDSEKSYQAVWTTTTSDNAGQIHFTVENAGPGSAACACPAGVWRETQQSTRAYFEQSVLGVFGGGSRRFVGGTRTLTLNPDHTGSFSYDGIELKTGEGTDLVLDQIQNGTSQFTWKVVNGQLLTVLRPGSGRLTQHNTMQAHGSVTNETRETAMQTIGHFFHCDEAGLHLTVPSHTPSFLPAGMTAGRSVNMDFQRIG